MDIVQKIFDTARSLNRHIILPEGSDSRIQEAARRITDQGLARVTLLHDAPIDGVEVIHPQENDDLPALIDAYHQLRAKKGVTAEHAAKVMAQPIPQAAMRVRLGMADGTVGGAITTTSDTVRAALQILGRALGQPIVSSFFLMVPPQGQPMIFADCALIIDPSADELAAIATQAARSCEQLIGESPQVAMLSFSTAGSAKHESIDRITQAVDLVRTNRPDLVIEGEIQFDAAFDQAVRERKAPNSPLSGAANVFVFPNLAAGNIGYKIAQRIGGVKAIGPILQGLDKPANDLSRGCNVDDIIAAVAITALQSK